MCGVVALKTADFGDNMNKWNYVKNNVTDVDVKEAENLSGFTFSDELKEIIESCNNGRPVKKLFDTERVKGRVLDKLLSISRADSENVFKVNEALKGQLPESFFALAADPFGNYICIDEAHKAFLWLHETSVLESTGKTIRELIDSLY